MNNNSILLYWIEKQASDQIIFDAMIKEAGFLNTLSSFFKSSPKGNTFKGILKGDTAAARQATFDAINKNRPKKPRHVFGLNQPIPAQIPRPQPMQIPPPGPLQNFNQSRNNFQNIKNRSLSMPVTPAPLDPAFLERLMNTIKVKPGLASNPKIKAILSRNNISI